MADPASSSPGPKNMRDFAHALGAPLCALEVILGARQHLPQDLSELLVDAVDRLRQVLAEAQAQAQSERLSPHGDAKV